MNVPLAALLRAARWRVARQLLALAAPWLALLAISAWLSGAYRQLLALALVGLLTTFFAYRQTRALDWRWLVRRLDALHPALEDSSALLIADPESLPTVARLQQARLLARWPELGMQDIRPPWRHRAWLVSACAALLCALLLLGLPRLPWPAPREQGNTVSLTSELLSARLTVTPPAYLGLPDSVLTDLAGEVPEGAQLRWRLQFSPEPQAVSLHFHDGTRVALRAEAGYWSGERRLLQGGLYRIVLEGAPALAPASLYRLDVRRDAAPIIRLIAPDKTLTVLQAPQPQWELAFSASDDVGLGEASLLVTLAQGSGEQVRVSERRQMLPGVGEARSRRYATTLDLKAMGFAEGDDVIVRFQVQDQRAPKPNISRSAALILRLPNARSADTAAMDGLLTKTLPAYFRSQRQIIIDTEALLAEKPRLSEADYLDKSDALGVDQKILRLRYGQFLGEEFESGQEGHAPETGADHRADAGAAAHTDGHEHAHQPEAAASSRFGEAGDVLAEFGHTHDQAEAATLLDPDTKRILKAALAQMWQAELKLRLGQGEAALPYEYQALDYIKQVQQSTRIYLARVGLELPPTDPARRLTGERSESSPPVDGLSASRPELVPATALYQALTTGSRPDWAGFDAWLRAHEAELPDALGLLADSDALQRQADCQACRLRLLARLWALLPQPASHVPRRRLPSAAQQAYREALEQ